jgi:site-specific DNA-methyltransferase (adenine-specific)
VSEKAAFSLKNRNPDVLTSIANLSNDEVFTPPSFANQMLDTIEEAWAKNNKGASIWEDKNVTFLDPFTKSGVFLREITRRLSQGLEKDFPNVQERLNHILTKQVFGVAITELTALLARRSLYCSKYANGKHSICTEFDTPEGNIWFERTEHTWVGGKEQVITVDDDGKEIEVTLDGTCKFCGAKQKEYERGLEAESHAYALIHTDDPKTWVKNTFGADMQFDVIVGNPPYQLDTGGSGRQARPIYQNFVAQAQGLEPRYLSMVVPSRWMSGGMGLAEFRREMLESRKIRKIVDFVTEKDAFPGINLNGGVCYFLWDSTHSGDCEFVSVPPGGQAEKPVMRQLDEFDILIRRNEALSIVRKVLDKAEPSFSEGVFPIDPFGFPTNFHGALSQSASKPVKLFGSGKTSWVAKSEVTKNQDSISSWKVLVGQATDGNESYPLPIWDLKGPFVARPDEICSWTYLVARLAVNEHEAESISRYMRTKFFRFLVWLRKPTQHNKAENFRFVPVQDWAIPLSDDYLFSKYKLAKEEIDFIESMIRPMELNDA